MTYKHSIGVIQPTRKFWRIFAAMSFALATLFATFTAANATSSTVQYTAVPFTQAEIDNNWFVDRAEPSGGYGSVSYASRDDVLEMSIDADNRSDLGSFYYTEGLQRELPDGTSAVKSEVYVESSWLSQDVRAGIWGVGHDDIDEVSAYPITEFTTAGEEDFTGWRVWDGVDGGWTNLPDVDYNADGWNELAIVLNSDTGMFDHYINGQVVASTNADITTDLGAVILNSYNYGPDEGADYDVHWSNFAYGNDIMVPESKDDCKQGGWEAMSFRNQGQCIRYVNTGQDSRIE